MLEELDEQIALRVLRTVEQHPDWLCRRGCSDCCRSLSRQPVLTRAEWERVRAAVAGLGDATRGEIEARIRAGGVDSRVCPLLNEASGECRVYPARPIACRTYGFYADREAGLYCGIIYARVDTGEFADVVWGNHESVERRLDLAGERRSMAEWLDYPHLGG